MKRKDLEGPEKVCQTPPKMTRSIVDKDKKYDRQLRCVAQLLIMAKKSREMRKIFFIDQERQ